MKNKIKNVFEKEKKSSPIFNHAGLEISILIGKQYENHNGNKKTFCNFNLDLPGVHGLYRKACENGS